MSTEGSPIRGLNAPALFVEAASGHPEEPGLGERVLLWQVETDGRQTWLGEGRLLGWLHRSRLYAQREARYSAPYFVIEDLARPARHHRDCRMPVVQLTRPNPPGPPPEVPVYPRCPDCGGELGLDEDGADSGQMRCYGHRQRCEECRGDGSWDGSEEPCPWCDGSGDAPRAGCGSLFVDARDGMAGPVPVLIGGNGP